MSGKKILKNAIALIILAVLIYLADVRQLWAALSNLSLEAVGILLAVAAVLIYISALKWKLFLHKLGSDVPVLRLFNLYLVGYFVNLLLPSYLGGDAVRSWYAGKKVGQHEALTATILERYTGIVAMVTLAFVFMWFVAQVTWQIKLAVIIVALGLLTITIVALSDKLLEFLGRFSQLQPVLKHLRKIQEGFQLAKRSPGLLLKTLALSFLYHTFTVVNTVIVAHAVGWNNPPIKDLFVVLPLILLIGALPVAPNGLGIQEGAFFYFLKVVGATSAQALGVGIILRAKTYVLALIGWISWMGVREK
jgi:uncharacterized protein (TIRG00374 family)